eukprot:CAMPEP_0173402662 /NCGR_PEP_ID=MMETSP1356-20130122/54593_1 /TAXON_ID=77927 ORGANISM="Hemiselmis virescens, Strain PCC157" /NCGR_SAMPLE_ID=MMETSP1356 /ASSEMBLY_ACC=CAM_ASM_000847 /LENGTH=47 /DNA_ID= /DNA_START= /DNA_END= /DNA_ORIENTATION=
MRDHKGDVDESHTSRNMPEYLGDGCTGELLREELEKHTAFSAKHSIC